jgi:hypothetical protein
MNSIYIFFAYLSRKLSHKIIQKFVLIKHDVKRFGQKEAIYIVYWKDDNTLICPCHIDKKVCRKVIQSEIHLISNIICQD